MHSHAIYIIVTHATTHEKVLEMAKPITSPTVVTVAHEASPDIGSVESYNSSKAIEGSLIASIEDGFEAVVATSSLLVSKATSNAVAHRSSNEVAVGRVATQRIFSADDMQAVYYMSPMTFHELQVGQTT